MDFYKSSSGGNDFILLEEMQFPEVKEKPFFIKDLCDRNSGVGGDGVILYRINKNETTFSIYNRDGSLAELSGNGMSGLASLLFFTGRAKKSVILSTDSGLRNIKLLERNTNKFRLNVEIGGPDFSNLRFFPFLKKGTYKYQFNGIEFYPVSVGNPHAVILFDERDAQFDFNATGKEFESAKIFPERTNVEFVPLSDRNPSKKISEVYPAFFERGVGITKLSSTGSAAVFATLRHLNLINEILTVKTENSTIEVSGQNNIYIENRTEIVYKGTYLKNEKNSY